jgi:hypothetical protein
MNLSVHLHQQITTTKNTNNMTTTKTHLGMAMGQGKINLHKSSCGLGDMNRKGRCNYITKTSTFKTLYLERGTELVCEKCLAKAKEQGRI